MVCSNYSRKTVEKEDSVTTPHANPSGMAWASKVRFRD